MLNVFKLRTGIHSTYKFDKNLLFIKISFILFSLNDTSLTHYLHASVSCSEYFPFITHILGSAMLICNYEAEYNEYAFVIIYHVCELNFDFL